MDDAQAVLSYSTPPLVSMRKGMRCEVAVGSLDAEVRNAYRVKLGSCDPCGCVSSDGVRGAKCAFGTLGSIAVT